MSQECPYNHEYGQFEVEFLRKDIKEKSSFIVVFLFHFFFLQIPSRTRACTKFRMIRDILSFYFLFYIFILYFEKYNCVQCIEHQGFVFFSEAKICGGTYRFVNS